MHIKRKKFEINLNARLRYVNESDYRLARLIDKIDASVIWPIPSWIHANVALATILRVGALRAILVIILAGLKLGWLRSWRGKSDGGEESEEDGEGLHFRNVIGFLSLAKGYIWRK